MRKTTLRNNINAALLVALIALIALTFAPTRALATLSAGEASVSSDFPPIVDERLDAANNTIAGAESLRVNTTVRGKMLDGSDCDYYKLALPYEGELRLEVEEGADDVRSRGWSVRFFTLEDGSDGSAVERDIPPATELKVNGGARVVCTFSDDGRLPAGEYYLCVRESQTDAVAESSFTEGASYLLTPSFSGVDFTLASVYVSDVAYTGEAQRPSVLVTFANNVLRQGVDYTLDQSSYTDNVNPGTAYVEVVGMGIFSGAVKQPFKIIASAAGSGGGSASSGETVIVKTVIEPAKTPVNATEEVSEADKAESLIAARKPMYRLYNPYSGEHFYTASVKERRKLMKVGWQYEGVGWYAPKSGKSVYRYFNPYVSDHHYTRSKAEGRALVKAGWKYEGIGWYTADKSGVSVYREYNPYREARNHNYTTSLKEHAKLVRLGWRSEGLAWYGVQ